MCNVILLFVIISVLILSVCSFMCHVILLFVIISVLIKCDLRANILVAC